MNKTKRREVAARLRRLGVRCRCGRAAVRYNGLGMAVCARSHNGYRRGFGSIRIRVDPTSPPRSRRRDLAMGTCVFELPEGCSVGPAMVRPAGPPARWGRGTQS